MTDITIKLDTKTIRKMLEEDPAFELKLQQAVIANIVRDMFPKYWENTDAAERIRGKMGALTDKALKDAANKIASKAKGPIRAQLSEMVDAQLENYVPAAIERVVKKRVDAKIKSLLK